MTYSSTHIFNVETKDFVHEGRCVRDHHCVAPRLTEGPHYDHPDCSGAKMERSFPTLYSTRNMLYIRFERHLFPNMSLMSGNTFPWSCFSLTTGSKDRFSRISFLSWNNLGYFLHFKPSSLFRGSCYWASFQPLVRPLDVLQANRRPWQTREDTLQRGVLFNALFHVGGWLPCQGKEGYWVKHHLVKLLSHGRILQSTIISWGKAKDCTSQGYLSSKSPQRGRVMTVPVVPPRYVNVVYLGTLNIAAWCATCKSGERIIAYTWCVLEEEPTERCEGSTKDRWPLHKDPTDHQVVGSDHDGHEMT